VAAWARANRYAPSPSERAANTLATSTSVPRIEARHDENADRSRRPVNRPVSETDRRPRSPEPLVTGGLSGGETLPEERRRPRTPERYSAREGPITHNPQCPPRVCLFQ
jgi:hypothetical protein